MSWLVEVGLLVEPWSLEGEAKGAEIQLPGPFGVRGGVGLPGTGECWKLEMTAGPPPGVGWGPRGDMLGISVLMRLSPGWPEGKMPGLEPPMLTRGLPPPPGPPPGN